MSKKKSRFCDGSPVAMFLDAQNISSITRLQTHALVNYAETNLGFIAHKAVYIDLKQFDCGAEKFFPKIGFDLFDIPGSKFCKNLADQQLIHDCRQYVQEHPQTPTIILGSQDGDFAKLAQELKVQGKQVIVVGASSQKQKVSKKLSRWADRVVYLDELEKALSLLIAA